MSSANPINNILSELLKENPLTKCFKHKGRKVGEELEGFLIPEEI